MLARTSFALRRAAMSPIAKPMAQRAFSSAYVLRKEIDQSKLSNEKGLKTFKDIKTEADLTGPGAPPGSVPSDMEQATGLERLELLGKLDGVDIFDMKPLDASRLGTLKEPIMVRSFGEEQYCGCTGFPADSHNVIWLVLSKARPVERCPECGSCYKMEYLGPEEDPHAHDHGHGDHHPPAFEEPKTMADFVKPEYY